MVIHISLAFGFVGQLPLVAIEFRIRLFFSIFFLHLEHYVISIAMVRVHKHSRCDYLHWCEKFDGRSWGSAYVRAKNVTRVDLADLAIFGHLLNQVRISLPGLLRYDWPVAVNRKHLLVVFLFLPLLQALVLLVFGRRPADVAVEGFFDAVRQCVELDAFLADVPV